MNQEILGYIAASLTTVSFLPQVIHTIKLRDTSSISLGMYSLFLVGTMCWLSYGVVLNSYPMIIANTLTVLLSFIIFVMKVCDVLKKGKEKFDVIHKVLHFMPAELAHDLAIQALKFYPKRKSFKSNNVDLSSEIFGCRFTNPVGLAAGFDKHGQAINGLANLGFSHIEIGSVTPKSQYGNPKPRLFRLSSENAIINRYGFNSHGSKKVKSRFLKPSSGCVTAINLGVNKNDFDYGNAFLEGVKSFNDKADYITLNISSPNTDGLRDIHDPTVLEPIIEKIRCFQRDSNLVKPLVVKISPDNEAALEKDLLKFLVTADIDGVIVSNTTTDKSMLEHKYKDISGGLSGLPLKEKSFQFLARAASVLYGHKTIISSGGIATGDDVYARLKLGADLVQIYTSFIYQGPSVIDSILQRLSELMIADGYASVQDIKREIIYDR
ncbi:dihydroorotate dehydrogenase (quinone) [Marinomonas sp. TI.3.20]|uniref:dihydroorotate dehydrogenase (quinone) n=1 Tax=Marinomonas sp. TI.3.20 TaxID=3121296 RepID=UPI00311DF79B